MPKAIARFRIPQPWRLAGYTCISFLVAFFVMFVSVAHAQDPPAEVQPVAPTEMERMANTVWVLFAGSLVFFMNAGFAMLETGLCRSQNAINLLAKNLIVFAIATISFWLVGFGLMFGGTGENLFVGTGGFLYTGEDPSVFSFTEAEIESLPLNATFFFQLTFAGTAATIVSGAVAERIRFGAFIAFSFFFIFIYSIIGHWVWGDGFLYDELGFRDFAGSTVVHSVGGWAGLMGAILLQPRLGKYRKYQPGETHSLKDTSFRGKKIASIQGHNLSFTSLGCFILWLGWFGFNAGSTLEANPDAISHILLVTLMAGATGAIAATFWAWLFYEKPSLSSIINGILAGCVSITAPCAYVNLPSAAFIGFVGGAIVIWATIILDKCEIDDPVSAVPVHLVCGIWGTLAVGLFALNPGDYDWSDKFFELDKGGLFISGNGELLLAQIVGIVAVGGFTVIFSTLIWIGVSFFMYKLEGSQGHFNVMRGLRVSRKEEYLGLDLLFADGEEIIDRKRDRIKSQINNSRSS